LCRADRELAVALRDAARRMRPPVERHAAIADVDVGMMILRLGELGDAADERDRVPEARELELAHEGIVERGPAFRGIGQHPANGDIAARAPLRGGRRAAARPAGRALRSLRRRARARAADAL